MACNGPTNEKWDGETCVGTPDQTSCSPETGETCYYADLQFNEKASYGNERYFGGRFVEKGKEAGDFEVGLPGPLADLGLKKGDIVNQINGEQPTAKVLLEFTGEKPARAAGVTRSTVDGITVWLQR